MYRVYYDDGSTFTGEDEGDRPEVDGVLIILQEQTEAIWATEFGGDFYLWKWGRWNSVRLEGLLRYLKARELIRPTVGRAHDVYHEGAWVQVDYIGFLEWLRADRIVLIGQLTDDQSWDGLMRRVQADKTAAEREGFLPE